MSSCINESSFFMNSTMPEREVSFFSPVSRRATTHIPFSMSLGPISRRSGIPRISASANLNPGLLSVRSHFTRRPAAESSDATSSTLSRTPSAFCLMGTIIICTGAAFGGRTSPESSPWTIITAPSILVDIPHEVWCTYFKVLSLSVY